MTYEEAVELCKNKEIEKLLEKDQLKNSGFDYLEHPITFLPTFKFDNDSDVYDTGKTHRIPSYTDRILAIHTPPKVFHGLEKMIFETDIIRHISAFDLPKESLFAVETPPANFPSDPEPFEYNSFPEVRLSDHRPVHALYKIKVLEDDPEKMKEFQTTLNQRLDEMDNLARPRLAADPNPLISHGTDEIEIKNISSSTVEWKIEPNDAFEITPKSGTLKSCSSTKLTITAKDLKDSSFIIINIVNGNPLFIDVKEKEE